MYGKKRLDIFLIGVLWLQLNESPCEGLTGDESLSFDQFKKGVRKLLVDNKAFGSDHILKTKM